MKVRSSTVAPIDFTRFIGSSDRPRLVAQAKSIARKQFRARLKAATLQDVLSGVEELRVAREELAQANVQRAYRDFMSRVMSKKRSKKAKQIATRGYTPVQDAYGSSSRKEVFGFADGKPMVIASCWLEDAEYA